MPALLRRGQRSGLLFALALLHALVVRGLAPGGVGLLGVVVFLRILHLFSQVLVAALLGTRLAGLLLFLVGGALRSILLTAGWLMLISCAVACMFWVRAKVSTSTKWRKRSQLHS